jgi:predicted Zn-dependent peptidase
VIKICIEEFGKMALISEKELEDGKMQIIGNYEVMSEDSSSVAQNLISEEIGESAEEYYKFRENIMKVSLDDIKNLMNADRYLEGRELINFTIALKSREAPLSLVFNPDAEEITADMIKNEEEIN